jgi:hypothetical protein
MRWISAKRKGARMNRLDLFGEESARMNGTGPDCVRARLVVTPQGGLGRDAGIKMVSING